MFRWVFVLCLVALPAWAQACSSPRQMDGFKTCADVAKAEQESQLVVYSTDPEAAAETLLAKFRAAFPNIRTNYLRIQAGGLYAKLLVPDDWQKFEATHAQFVREWNKLTGMR